MKKKSEEIWKTIKKLPLSSYVILWFVKNLSFNFYGVQTWYEDWKHWALLIIFLPIVFVYAEIDKMLFKKTDQNNYHIETDFVVIGLFLLLDLLLLCLRSNFLKRFLKNFISQSRFKFPRTLSKPGYNKPVPKEYFGVKNE